MSKYHRDKTLRLTVGQAIVKYLKVQFTERDGVEQRLIPGLWGIYGHGNVIGLGQAMLEYGEGLTYYQPRNEQSMVHAAAAFAKARLRLATMACTSSIGPGATNMISGAALATVNRLPVLLLPSDYYATRRQGPVLQQLEHPISADVSVNDCFRPISRFFDRVLRPEQLLTALPEAMRVLTDPAETGTVTLALPQDLQAFAGDFPEHFFSKRIWQIQRRPPERRSVEEAVRLLAEAKRPVVIAGGGVVYSDAGNAVLEFVKEFGIPIGETTAGLGAIQEQIPLHLGGHGTNGTPVAAQIAAKADLVIAVGTRLTDFSTGSQTAFQNPNVRFININVGSHDAYKQGALPILADAREAIVALHEAARAAGITPHAEYVNEVADVVSAWRRQRTEEVFATSSTGQRLSIGQIIGVLNDQAQENDAIVAAAGFAPGDLLQLWDATGGRRAQIEFGYSCMGYELPAGLGVRMAHADAGEVFVFLGDGTYLLTPPELVTALQENIKITVLLINNHGFQSIRGLQVAKSGEGAVNEFRQRGDESGRLDGEYLEIDYVKHAEALGARGWSVSTADELRHALNEARTETRSCLISVETDGSIRPPASGMYWDFEVAEVSSDPTIVAMRQQFEESRVPSRLYY